MATNKKVQPYLVFSTTRDIFFGYAEATGPRMVLANARRVYYYAKPVQNGVGGPDSLAVFGPAPGSKIGPETQVITVENVANSSLCTSAAEKAFKESSWQ